MHVPELFHAMNDLFCCLLAYPLNGALVWLVLKHTHELMHPYRPALLLSTVTDLIYLTIFAVVVPVMPNNGGRIAIISLGPLGWVPQPYNFVLVAAWLYFFMFSLYSIWVPFAYRYANICHAKEWGMRVFLAMLTAPMTLTAVHICLFYRVGYTHTEEVQQEARDFFAFNKSYVVPYFTRTGTLARYTTANLLFTYGMSFTFAYRLQRFLNKRDSPQLRDLNRQVNRALLLQLLVPFVLQFLPGMLVTLSMLSGAKIGHLTIYQTGIFSWIGVINPCMTMWIVQAYRKQIMIWLAGIKELLQSIIHPTPLPVTQVFAIGRAHLRRGALVSELAPRVMENS